MSAHMPVHMSAHMSIHMSAHTGGDTYMFIEVCNACRCVACCGLHPCLRAIAAPLARLFPTTDYTQLLSFKRCRSLPYLRRQV